MDMQFDFSSINRMAAAYKGGQKVVLEETRKGITKAVIAIEADAKRLVPTDTHTLQRSITHEVQASGQNVTGRVGSNLVYAPVVEYGRSAGSTPPPSIEVARWLKRKGMDVKLAYVIARSIGRRGTRKRPYLKPALAKNRQVISREMDQVLRRIATRLAAGR